MYGFNTVSLDKKGRLAIPAKYRSYLISNNETKIIVTKDPQYPSLKIYPGSQWELISSKLESLQGARPNSKKSSMDNSWKCQCHRI